MKRFAAGAAVLAMAGLGLVLPSATATPIEIVDDGIPKCDQFVPAWVSVSEVETTLNVLVLLDQADSQNPAVSEATAQSIVDAANLAYDPLEITLKASYLKVDFTGTESAALIAQTKTAVKSARPPDIDLVYGLTNKDLTVGGNKAVAGQADCIGGIAYADRAFAVGEVGNESFNILGLTFNADFGAKVMAHELGHLLGAHHHYANCVEAAGTLLLSQPADACTLMFNAVDLQQLKFSTLNGLVVRGNAQKFG